MSNYFETRAASLTGKARDITQTRDGFVFAALAAGATGASVSAATGLSAGNISRGWTIVKNDEALLAIATDMPKNSKDGDPVALKLGADVARRLTAARAKAATKKDSATASRETGESMESGDGSPVTPASVAPLTTDDILAALASLAIAAGETVWGPTAAAKLEGILAELAVHAA
jgi:hypothetical protein